MKKTLISTLLLTVTSTLLFTGCGSEESLKKYEQINNEYKNSKLEKIKINVIKQNIDNDLFSSRKKSYILCVEGYQWFQYQEFGGSASQMFVEDEKTGLSKPIKCQNF